ncbi:DUF4760 domain-containing protein [Pseudoalteromonas lipolytica]|uniref:DUF4760 domain-containing protein n=1 Tax=Pseudoalteromonas lipolytica TaxID=570156 RepID=A0ABU8SXP1_9GAMM
MKVRKKHIELIVIYFISVSLVGGYLIKTSNGDYISAVAILLSAFIAISGALITIYFQRRTAREKNTLEFQNDLQENEDYHKNVLLINKLLANHKDDYIQGKTDTMDVIRTLASPELVRSEEAVALRDVLNKWEQAANAIRHGLLDEKYLYSSHKSTVLFMGVWFRSFIKERQKSNESLYLNFTWLVLKWTIRRDSFENDETRKQIRAVFKQLNNIKHGKIKANQK